MFRNFATVQKKIAILKFMVQMLHIFNLLFMFIKLQHISLLVAKINKSKVLINGNEY